VAIPALIASSSATSISTAVATSGPPSSLARASAPARSRSATITQAPWAARAEQVARPIPEAPPVTRATRPARGLGFPIRRSFASSSGQYSTANFSASSTG
jgi:hypothetical protein